MKIIPNLVQGSAAWHAHRAHSHNASDAPAMLGESPHCTRDELLQRMHTGITPDVDGGTQRRFDKGHAVEALLRPHAEALLGEPLHAFVAVADFDENLSASFDGCTFVGEVTLECKLLNERLRAAFADMETIAPAHREHSAGKSLPIDYRIQMEQQVRVAGAERSLFMTGELREDGTLGDVLSCWYYPDDALWARIHGGWDQFDVDLAAYVPPAASVEAVAAPIEALPAVSVRMDGALAVVSNLDVFGSMLRAFVAKIPAAPASDQDFADCDAACKALRKAEEALDAAEANALGQITSVEQLTRTIADLRKVASTARLASEKLVKRRKDEIKLEQVQRGKDGFAKHLDSLNTRLGGAFMPTVPADFPGAISGLKKFDSLKGAINSHLSTLKIEANRIADGIDLNLRWLRDNAADHKFLFNDVATLVLRDAEYVALEGARRIAEHKLAEQKKLDDERERIRKEELARIEREQEAARQAELRQQQEKEAAEARQAAQAAAPAPTPAPVAVAAPAAVSAAPAASSSTVVPIKRAAPDAPPIRLGQIGDRLGFTVTADFLKSLGFEPVAIEKAAKLYRASDFDLICEALVAHVRTVQHQQLQAA